MKKSFIIYSDLKCTVDKLPDEKAGVLFKRILDYSNGIDVDSNDLIIEIAFEPVKQSLIRDLEKYEERAERSRSNGTKGGRPIITQNNPVGYLETKQVKNKPRKPDSDSDSDSVSDSEIKKINITAKASITKSNFKNWTKLEFAEDVKKNGKPYDGVMLKAFYDHWIEESPSGKMKLQLEKTWQTELRLKKWKINAETYNLNTPFKKNNNSAPVSVPFSRASNGIKIS